MTASKPIAKPAAAKSMPANASCKSVSTLILSIISEEAGVDLKDLGPSADFADYGIDSLLSLNITGRMKEELGLDLPSSVFADYPTVKELTAFVDAGNPPASSSASSSDFEKVEAIELESSSEDDMDGYETSASSVDESLDVIKIIRDTIAEETGIDPAELTDSSSFAELGIDSLLALNVSVAPLFMSRSEGRMAIYAQFVTFAIFVAEADFL
jgi:naphtho-gamma-pyrone polyketide synthase